MIEADSHLKMLSASILGIYKVFEHIDMLSIRRHKVAAFHNYPPYLAHICGL
jgi:hypothetical protein